MIICVDDKNKLLFQLWKFCLKIMSERKRYSYFTKSETFN